MADSLLSHAALGELAAIAAAAPPGAFAEFGVYQGGVAQRLAAIARAQGRALYLFDTFTGIPFSGEHDRHQVGDFSDTSLEAVRALIPDAIIIPGIFPQSLELHSCTPAPLAFVHVDADQYESLRAAIKIFPPLMVSGAAMLFDDYGCLPGATRAVREWGEPIQISANGKALWLKP
jgi:O-methyltransferase